MRYLVLLLLTACGDDLVPALPPPKCPGPVSTDNGTMVTCERDDGALGYCVGYPWSGEYGSTCKPSCSIDDRCPPPMYPVVWYLADQHTTACFCSSNNGDGDPEENEP